MFNLLIDTCVWLDLAKDHQQHSLLSVLETLIEKGRIRLILPRLVIDEFNRNKARVVEESSRSLSAVLKRVKDAVNKFGQAKRKKVVLQELDEVDHRMPLVGDTAASTVARIETIFRGSTIRETTDAMKLRAAQRAIDKKAPFHRGKNAMNDAILIELYATLIAEKDNPAGRARFAFVTHNKSDFSHPTADQRLPHPDIAPFFSMIKSLYIISLAEALKRIEPGLVTDLMMEQEWTQETRRLSEILHATEELLDKIWYDRHQLTRQMIEEGKTKIVANEEWCIENNARTIKREIWQGALKAANRVEEKYGSNNLGPWTKFEWGMLNGKLSALRWVLGDDWDMLDT